MAAEWRWEGSNASGRNQPYSPALGCPEELALGKSQRSGVGRGRPSVLVGLTKVGRFKLQQSLLPQFACPIAVVKLWQVPILCFQGRDLLRPT